MMRFVKMMAAATVVAGTMAAASIANAAPVITIAQVGNNVVATTVGTLNITGLTAVPNYSLSLGAYPASGYIATGAADGASVTGYTGFAGPTTFGTGATYVAASSGTGISFAINASGFGAPYVFVSPTFVSGSSVAGTSTFLNQTLASLGFTSGSYVFRSANDTVTVNIGSAVAAVPEPATWGMMLVGFGAMGFAMRRRAKVRTSVSLV